MDRVTRRSVIVAASAAGLAAAFPLPARARDFAAGTFTHGVASGDPLKDAVIIWTRFMPAGAGVARIGWEVADDETFARIVAAGEAEARPESDWCVKADVQGLAPGRPYAYRFVAGSGPSPTGLTRTAPDGAADALNLALFSCSNLGFGWFNAYGHAAARPDIDVCVHVGDYIYEYKTGRYPSEPEIVAGRVIDPTTEIVALSDYYRRYASYRSDPDLQELHRVKPWIVVWDDHELTNDTWKDGAENHDPATQGTFADRMRAAMLAYDHWMPIRTTPAGIAAITRRFDWGDLATILALDTRFIGRDEPFGWRKVLEPHAGKGEAEIVAAAMAFARGPLADPARTLMGSAQEAWLAAEMQRSKDRGCTWQVLAQQVLAGAQAIPAGFAAFLGADASEGAKRFFATGAAMGRIGLPFNLDAWGGYPAARERLLATARTRGANTLVLAGDSHNAWAHNLGGTAGQPDAIELGATGVSSPGFERALKAAPAGAREQAMMAANPEVAFCDLTNKGYVSVKLTKTAAEALFVATGPVAARDARAVSETRLVAEATDGAGVGAWVRV